MTNTVKTDHIGNVRVEVESTHNLIMPDHHSVLATNKETGKTAHVDRYDRQQAIDMAVKKVR